MKICSKCGETKPLTGFGKVGRVCRACKNLASKEWANAHPGRVLARVTEWAKTNPEKVKKAKAKYAADNRKKCAASSAKWWAANPEKTKVYSAKRYSANPEAFLLYNHNRRARERDAGGRLSVGLTYKLFTLQKGRCACGCKQPLGDDFHRDHIMPLALGGSNTDDNIQLLRSTCNLQKHAKHPVDFMQQRGFLL